MEPLQCRHLGDTTLFSEKVDITNNGVSDIMCPHLPNEIQWDMHITYIVLSPKS